MGTSKWVAAVLLSTKRGVAIAEMAGAPTPTALRWTRSMSDNTSAVDKSIVGELNFGAKTSKRVGWEAWEFTVESPHLVRVTNAAYGFEKDDHSYLVGIKDRDGLLVPAECGCKADKFREEYDCKHKVALATIGGPVVLEAAASYQTPSVDTDSSDTSTGDDLLADGGMAIEETCGESEPLDVAKHTNCDCPELSDDFPCWSCVRTGEQELPE